MTMTLSKKTSPLSPSLSPRAVLEVTALCPLGTRMLLRTGRQVDVPRRARTPSSCWNLTPLLKVSSVFRGISLPVASLVLAGGLRLATLF